MPVSSPVVAEEYIVVVIGVPMAALSFSRPESFVNQRVLGILVDWLDHREQLSDVVGPRLAIQDFPFHVVRDHGRPF